VHVTSDRLKALPATLSWTVTDAKGKLLEEGTKFVKTPVNGNKKAATLRLKKLLAQQTETDLLIWLKLETKGEPTQTNLVTFAKPKHLDLPQAPSVSVTVRKKGTGSCEIRLKSKQVALWTWLELEGMDASFSDNFVHLPPGHPETITVTAKKALTVVEVKKRLRVRNLADLSREP